MATLWGTRRRAQRLADDDRGDVPGWVLITLMTAALIVTIWLIAGPAIEGIVRDAFTRLSI